MPLTAPTGARMITLRDCPIPGAPLPQWPSRDPTDDANYALGFAGVIEGPQTIISAVPTITDDPLLNILAVQVIGSTVVLRATGGTDGGTAQVGVTVTLSDGQTFTKAAQLPVAQQIPPNPITDAFNDMMAALGEYYMGNLSSIPTVQSGSTGVDHSIGVSLPSGSPLVTVAANITRANIEIQNQSTSQIQIVRSDGNGTNKTVRILGVVNAVGGPPPHWESLTFKGQIDVYGPTGSQVSISQD